jgi:hypothetical protein
MQMMTLIREAARRIPLWLEDRPEGLSDGQRQKDPTWTN